METLDFTKGHGTGNDFLLVADPDGVRDLPPRLVAALCDRRYGVGADGLLRVVRASRHPKGERMADGPPGAGWFMDYRNADGSVAEMCGNGVRVFARYLVAEGLVAGAEPVVATRSGPVPASVTGGSVSVTLPPPRRYGAGTVRVGGRELAAVAVDCGNPHLVCEVPSAADLAGLDLTVPPAVPEGDFPDGVNVELAVPAPDGPGTGDRVRMRVYERGVGETRSCGSGACAVATATLHTAGRSHGTVTVEAPGGALTVSVSDRAAVLTGPAVLVARGTVDVDALART